MIENGYSFASYRPSNIYCFVRCCSPEGSPNTSKIRQKYHAVLDRKVSYTNIVKIPTRTVKYCTSCLVNFYHHSKMLRM